MNIFVLQKNISTAKQIIVFLIRIIYATINKERAIKKNTDLLVLLHLRKFKKIY